MTWNNTNNCLFFGYRLAKLLMLFPKCFMIFLFSFIRIKNISILQVRDESTGLQDTASQVAHHVAQGRSCLVFLLLFIYLSFSSFFFHAR